MAKYQNQFIATSSYNGDILFWNVGTFRPILNFNASQSPLPLLPKRVQSAEACFLLRAPLAVGQNHVGLGSGSGTPWEVEGSDGDLF